MWFVHQELGHMEVEKERKERVIEIEKVVRRSPRVVILKRKQKQFLLFFYLSFLFLFVCIFVNVFRLMTLVMFGGF